MVTYGRSNAATLPVLDLFRTPDNALGLKNAKFCLDRFSRVLSGFHLAWTEKDLAQSLECHELSEIEDLAF